MIDRSISRRSTRGGFSLLEMILVISIMAIIAGSAVPLATMAINSKAKRATAEELDGLQLAAAEYFQDTGELPSTVSDMEQNPSVDGWAGPYLQAYSINERTGLSQYAVDAWSQAYSLSSSGSVLTITSPGLGGTFGDEHDIAITLDVTPIRRDQTLATLEIVNRAIGQYNTSWLATDPLPANYSTILSKLVTKGYLPASEPFATDGWGDALVPDPVGRTPVVQVGSIHLGVSGAGAKGVGGKAKGEGKGKGKG